MQWVWFFAPSAPAEPFPCGDGRVYDHAERGVRRHGGRNRQPAMNQPRRIAIDQLDVDPINEQRMAAEPRERLEKRRPDTRQAANSEQKAKSKGQDAESNGEVSRRAGPERCVGVN